MALKASLVGMEGELPQSLHEVFGVFPLDGTFLMKGTRAGPSMSG